MINSSIWLVNWTQSGATIQDQSGHGSNGNEGVIHIPQSSMTGALQSNSLMSYPEN